MAVKVVFYRELNMENAYTTSRKIALQLGKNHKDIVKTIKTQHCSEAFRADNYVESTFTTKLNRVLPEFKVSWAGYIFLMTGQAGALAGEVKERFVKSLVPRC